MRRTKLDKPITLAEAEELDYMYEVQLHAGKNPFKEGSSVFCTDPEGKWWSGWQWRKLDTKQLLDLVRSVEADLLRTFKDLE